MITRFFLIIFVILQISCNKNSTSIGLNEYISNCDKFETDSTYHSPKSDYSISIPSNWNIIYPDINNLSSVIFDNFDHDTTDYHMVSIYMHHSKFESLEEELEMFSLDTSVNIIRHGYTNILNKDSIYFVEYFSLYDNIHSVMLVFNEYHLTLTCAYVGKKSDIEICRMFNIVNSFKLN